MMTVWTSCWPRFDWTFLLTRAHTHMHVMSACISQIAETPGSLYFTSVCEGKPSIRTLSLEPRPNVVRNSPCKFMIVEYLTSHTIQSQTLLLYYILLRATCTCIHKCVTVPILSIFSQQLNLCRVSYLNAKVASVTAPLRSPLIRFKSAWMQIASTKRGSSFRACHPNEKKGS